MVPPQSIPNGGEQDTNNTQIENQYKEFVSTNENFFNNLENFEAPIPQEVKNDIDTLVNENDIYSNLDSFEFKDELEPEPEPECKPNRNQKVLINFSNQIILKLTNFHRVL